MSPLTVCVFCGARRDQKARARRRRARRASRTRAAAAASRARRRRTPASAKPRSSGSSPTRNSPRMAPNGEQEVALLHRRGEQALEELARAHLDDDVADAPHAPRHEVHADQAGHEEVDVARARARSRARRRPARRIRAAVGALQDVVDDGARQAALGPRRVVLGRCAVAPGTTTIATLPVRSASRARVGVEELDAAPPCDACSACEHRVGAVARLHRGPHRLGRPVAEGDAERDRRAGSGSTKAQKIVAARG